MIWLLGVDGGGSKTAAKIATLKGGKLQVRGSGAAGPSNIRAVGAELALANLDEAIDSALDEAGRSRDRCDVAVLALAGSSLPDVRQQVHTWAGARMLAAHTDIVHDADAVLAMLPPDVPGVALILGTGSAAMGRGVTNERVVVGGWGHQIGDFGSAYDLGRRALIAVTTSVDGMGPKTALLESVLAAFSISEPGRIVAQLDAAGDPRQRIASLAAGVLTVSEQGDAVAADIVRQASAAAASLVGAAIERLGIEPPLALALAGGTVCNSRSYRKALLARLAEDGRRPQPLVLVPEPVDGSLALAAGRAANR